MTFEETDIKPLTIHKPETMETFDVLVTRREEEGRVEFEGLPRELLPFLTNFNDAEKFDDPCGVLNCVFTLHGALCNQDMQTRTTTLNDLSGFLDKSLSQVNVSASHIKETYAMMRTRTESNIGGP